MSDATHLKGRQPSTIPDSAPGQLETAAAEQPPTEAPSPDAEAILRQDQRLAALGLLTSGIVHDLKNILSVIMLKLEVMADDLPPDSAQQKRIAETLDATARGTTLISGILDYGRRHEQAPEDIQVGDVLQSLAGLLTTAVPPDIVLSVHAAEGLPSCRIDRSRFETAILNLVVNARDATPRGGEIAVTAQYRPLCEQDSLPPGGRAGDWIEVSVRDNGAGMSREIQARAFEPFFTTKGDGQGTGLGLSMVRDFVSQSGGFLTLDSSVHRGTALAMYFPTAASGGAEAPHSGDSPSAGAASTPCTPRAKRASSLSKRVPRRPIGGRDTKVATGRPVNGNGATRQWLHPCGTWPVRAA